ncbi:thiosulfate sulfurtransferase [Aureococcus anophagefferens]|nr:thiosulfate sulfurtransferase [Aureococcus anophagefferens]
MVLIARRALRVLQLQRRHVSSAVGLAESSNVATISLKNAATRNALSLAVLEDLHTALGRADGAGAIVLRSSSQQFCSGHDLDELRSATADERRAVFEACGAVMRALRRAPPVVCAVRGAAFAAGCELAATCDLVVAEPAAKFATPGVKIGLFCHTPAVAVAAALGHPRRAAELLYTGDPISAADARDLGLVHRIVDDADDAAAALAAKIATVGSAAAARHGKRVLARGVDVEASYARARTAMVDGLEHADALSTGFEHLSVVDAAARLEADAAATYLDCRSAAEVATGVVEGSVNIPYPHDGDAELIEPAEFVADADAEFARDDTILVGCRSGSRSILAAEILVDAGFTNVLHVDGGMNAWFQAGLPVAPFTG